MSTEVNLAQCETVGRIIHDIQIRPSFFDRPFLRNSLDTEVHAQMIIWAVAVCHQTYLLHSPEKNLFGWDYIEEAFVRHANENPMHLSPALISKMPIQSIAEMLAAMFSDSGKPEETTLDRLDERARLMKNLAAMIAQESGGSVSRWIGRSQGKVSGKSGLYSLLSGAEAFADPERKKSSFLIKLLVDARLFDVSDPENLFPVMDYHIQRVLLRTGCVEIASKDLADKLRKRIPLESDEVVRKACITAMRIITLTSGHSVLSMNDYFWPFGRSCCNEQPLCVSGKCQKSPCSFSGIADIPKIHSCVFAKICKGHSDANIRAFWQPVVITHYY
ncbi:MAG: hypothetical protein KKA07_03325 [Bacteroidetes bacterium]|nr:hypothetical protein [Bacteroidota bacterium]MBU1718083.1 hypothetical protein [Bacteroidota bacterium]